VPKTAHHSGTRDKQPSAVRGHDGKSNSLGLFMKQHAPDDSKTAAGTARQCGARTYRISRQISPATSSFSTPLLHADNCGARRPQPLITDSQPASRRLTAPAAVDSTVACPSPFPSQPLHQAARHSHRPISLSLIQR